MPVTQFADTASIARPTLSQILSGRNKKVSNELIAKLHAAFPDLNVMWLLFGDGDMISDVRSESSGGQNLRTPASPGSLFADSQDDNRTSHGNATATESQQTMRGATPSGLPGAISAGFIPTTTLNAFQGLGASSAAEVSADSPKRVQSIMVFYTDNSYELFTPAKK